MKLKCEAIRSLCTGATTQVLIFGRIAEVIKSAPHGCYKQCIAEDENGITYEIYTDYDACIIQSKAFAVPIK